MKNFKRIIACVMCIAMIVSLASCKKNNNASNGETVTLTWLVPGDKQPDLASVLDEANKIVEENIGAKIDLQFIDAGAFTEKMTMNMASGLDFDLCFTGWVNPYVQAVQKGGLMDITDMIDNYPDLKAAIPEYAWDVAKIDGRIYAVPNLQIMAVATSLVIFKDIADKYDFDFSKVKTIDDIEPYLEMVKNGEPGIFPYRTNYGITPWYADKYEELTSNLVILKDGSSSKVSLLRDTEEFKHAVETLHDWYNKGYIRPDVLSASDDNTDYMAGKYAVSHTMLKPGVEAELKAQTGRDVIVVPLADPYLTKDKGTATMIGIGQNSKNPEKALEFIQLINTNDELYNLISFGIEGKHYTKNEEGKVVFIDNSGYAPKAAWKFGNQFKALITDGQDDDVWEKTEAVNNEAVKSPLLGFVFDNTNVKSEISQIETVLSEYGVLNSGAKDPSGLLDGYNSKLDTAGQRKIAEEMQKQIDAYWETK